MNAPRPSALWVVAFAAILGCSEEKPAEAPKAPEAPADAPETPEGVQPETTTRALPPPKVTMTGVSPGGSTDQDYLVTERDCDELGKAYGAVTRADLEAQLSPKLSAKQRATTGRSIDKAAAKMEAQAGNACRSSMLGLTRDRGSLKCAMDAKTAKAFDACLNGPASAPPPKK